MLTGCLLHEFDKCIGVELLDSLYKKSVEMKKSYEEEFVYGENSSKVKSLFGFTNAPIFEVYKADILEFDWSNADFVLINSTCFEHKFMIQISEKAA